MGQIAPFQDNVGARQPPRSVSVLINNYNYGRFVGEAIESALAQTHPVQVVVVDDGSVDDSRAVITAFGDRIQAVFQANAGQAAAMNTGFSLATGDIIIFLDADDMLEPRVAASVLAAWRPGTVLMQYALRIVDVVGRTRGIYPDPPSLLAQGDVRRELLETGSYSVNVTSGLAFLRSALSQVMPLPAAELPNAADGYMVRAVAFLGMVQRIEAPLGSYRQHGGNDSNVNAAAGGLAEGFRKKLRYVTKEFEFTRRFAAIHGFAVSPDLEDRSADYLGYRLFLRLTDVASAPVAGEPRMGLLFKYLCARWATDWPLHRRLLAMGSAAVASAAPRRVACMIVRWLHDPSTRPRLARFITLFFGA